jgi:hypothetical protein
MVINNTGAQTGLGNQSADYGEWDITVEENPGQQGIWVAAGQTFVGARVAITGNFNGGTTNNGAVIRCTGHATTTHGGTTGSQFSDNATLYVAVEYDGSGVGPVSLVMGDLTGSSYNLMYATVWAMFLSFGPTAVGSNCNLCGSISIAGGQVSDVNWYTGKQTAALTLTYSATGTLHGGYTVAGTIVYSVAPVGGNPQITMGAGLTSAVTLIPITPAGMALLTGVPYYFSCPVPTGMYFAIYDNASTTHGTATVTAVITRRE